MSIPNFSTIPKLTGAENFLLWSELVIMHLAPDFLHRHDHTIQMHARHAILTTVDAVIAQNLIRFKTAKKMWDALHDVYAEAANMTDGLEATSPLDFDTFDSFMWTYVGKLQKLCKRGRNVSEADAMVLLLEILERRCSIDLSREIDTLRRGSSRHKTLLQLVGWLCADYRLKICSKTGWKR